MTMTFSASELRAMANTARRAADSVGFSGDRLVSLGRTNLRVRYSSSTYVARGAGIVASCTAGAANAARAWAIKADAAAAALEGSE